MDAGMGFPPPTPIAPVLIRTHSVKGERLKPIPATAPTRGSTRFLEPRSELGTRLPLFKSSPRYGERRIRRIRGPILLSCAASFV